jgi:hypothetical protein
MPKLIPVSFVAMAARLLLPVTALFALFCFAAPGVSACEKHMEGHSTATPENPTEAAKR